MELLIDRRAPVVRQHLAADSWVDVVTGYFDGFRYGDDPARGRGSRTRRGGDGPATQIDQPPPRRRS